MHPFHPEYIFTVFLKIVPYVGVTLLMMLGTVIFGGLIGILLARANVKRRQITALIRVRNQKKLSSLVLTINIIGHICCGLFYNYESRLIP